MTVQPRIYVACLAAYNNGQLHGQWIDVEDADQVRADIAAMLSCSPQPDAEEWAIHDHSDLGNWVSEYANIDQLCQRAEFISNTGDIALELLDYCGGDVDHAQSLAESYAGSADTFAEWVEDFYRETNPPIPESLEYYIDWQAMARDWQLSGDFAVIEHQGAVHVYFNN
jgi:antirestriction protein